MPDCVCHAVLWRRWICGKLILPRPCSFRTTAVVCKDTGEVIKYHCRGTNSSLYFCFLLRWHRCLPFRYFRTVLPCFSIKPFEAYMKAWVFKVLWIYTCYVYTCALVYAPAYVPACTCAYIIMCPLLSSACSLFCFMFYNTFTNQRVRKKFQKYWEKVKDIFGRYIKILYFCIRFRERERRLIDILTETE